VKTVVKSFSLIQKVSLKYFHSSPGEKISPLRVYVPTDTLFSKNGDLTEMDFKTNPKETFFSSSIDKDIDGY